MGVFRRFRLMAMALPVVAVIVLLKLVTHRFGLEVLGGAGLIPSIIAGAVFLIGFLLSHVLADYREAERQVGEMRVALEAIHADVESFGRHHPEFDRAGARALLADIVARFEACLGRDNRNGDLTSVLDRAEDLTGLFARLERQHMSERYIVRLRGAQDVLRRALFRIAYIQRMQIVPSVHVMVQSLVACCIILMLFVQTASTLDGTLVTGFVSYMFVYALILVRHLERPFRKGEHTVDDVSIFLLRDFAARLDRESHDTAAPLAARESAAAHRR